MPISRLNLTKINRHHTRTDSAEPTPRAASFSFPSPCSSISSNEIRSPEDELWLHNFFSKYRAANKSNSPTAASSASSESSSEWPWNLDQDAEGKDDIMAIFRPSESDEISRLLTTHDPIYIPPVMTSATRMKPRPGPISILIPQSKSTHTRAYSGSSSSSFSDSTSNFSRSGSPASASSLSSFNPKAPPFVPGTAFNQPSQQPQWLPYLWSGTSTKDFRVHQQSAALLVGALQSCGSSLPLSTIAQQIIAKATVWKEQSRSGVAPFARVVYTRFRDVCSDQVADQFLSELEKHALSAFEAAWKFDSTDTISLSNPSSGNRLPASLGLTIGIADLFTQDLIQRSVIQRSLSILLQSLNTIEHIHAIQLLVQNSGARLWKSKGGGKQVRDFVVAFTQRSSALERGMSVLGTDFEKTEVAAYVKEVVDLIHRWCGLQVDCSV